MCPTEYHVFSDGSAPENGERPTSRYGVGFVVKRKRKVSHYSRRLKEEGPLNHSVATLFATAAALNEVPERSRVVIYADDRRMVHAINWQELGTNAEKAKPGTPLHRALKELFRAVVRHKNVRAIVTQTDDNEHLAQAHRLALQGGTLDFAHDERSKPRRTQKASAIAESLELNGNMPAVA